MKRAKNMKEAVLGAGGAFAECFGNVTVGPFLPEEYAGHPLVRDKLYFTLPDALLTAVLREVGAARFDQELLQVERTLSARCGDHTWQVGFWGGRPISYSLLRRLPVQVSVEMAQKLGWQMNARQLAGFLDTANARLSRNAEIARGYCGCLPAH